MIGSRRRTGRCCLSGFRRCKQLLYPGIRSQLMFGLLQSRDSAPKLAVIDAELGQVVPSLSIFWGGSDRREPLLHTARVFPVCLIHLKRLLALFTPAKPHVSLTDIVIERTGLRSQLARFLQLCNAFANFVQCDKGPAE